MPRAKKKKSSFLGMDLDFSWGGFRKFAKGTKKGMTKAYGGTSKRRRRRY